MSGGGLLKYSQPCRQRRWLPGASGFLKKLLSAAAGCCRSVEVHWSGVTKGYQGKRIDNTSLRDEPYVFRLGAHEVTGRHPA